MKPPALRSQALYLAAAAASIVICIAAPDGRRIETPAAEPPATGAPAARLRADDVDVREAAALTSVVPTDARVALLGFLPGPAATRPSRKPVAVAHFPELASRDEPVAARVVVSHLDAGTPPVTIESAVAHGDLRFGGYAPGPSRLFVDVQGFAPITIERAELGAHLTTLGDFDLCEGRAVRVEIDGSPAAPARVVVKATSSSQPRYVRRVTIAKGETMTLSGLGPGRFDVCVQTFGPELRIVTRTIDVVDADAALSID